MKNVISALILGGALLSGGCATKKYVAKTIDPISGKLDQVAKQSDQQGQKLDQTGQSLDQTKQSLDQTRQNLEKDEIELNATKERATSAETRYESPARRTDELGRLALAVSDDASSLDRHRTHARLQSQPVRWLFRLAPTHVSRQAQQ